MTKRNSQTPGVEEQQQKKKLNYATESDADTYTLDYLKKQQEREEEEDDQNSELDFFTEDEMDSQYSRHELSSLRSETSMSFDGESEQVLDKFQIHRANIIAKYTNFDSKEDISNSLQTYNWEDNARGVIQKYCPEIAEAMTAQTEYAFEMTANNFGTQ